MLNSWENTEKAVLKSPLGAISVLFCIVIVISVISVVLGWFGEVAQVAHDEFAPKAALKKYEWFKDASASLNKLSADVDVAQGRIDAIKEDYSGIPRSEWPRDDRQAMSLWQSEVAGTKQIYNGLVAEYNAASNKFNWGLFDKTDGDIPPKTYEEK